MKLIKDKNIIIIDDGYTFDIVKVLHLKIFFYFNE